MKNRDRKTSILKLAKSLPVITSREVKNLNYGARDLWELAKAGHLERIGRGQYRHPHARVHSHQDLIEVATRVPDAVFCLLTALSLHGLGTQMPPTIWIALPTFTRAPKFESGRLKVIKMSPKTFSFGIMHKKVNGSTVRVTDPAKTVADCFHHRSKVGTDAAVEALREGLRKKAFTSDELYHAALINRVWNVIRPYAEALA